MTVAASGRPTLWNATWTDHLKHDLLMKYDKFARPAQHTNVTEVTFGLIIKHVEVVSQQACYHILLLNCDFTSFMLNSFNSFGQCDF